jgi:hypothetical protein
VTATVRFVLDLRTRSMANERLNHHVKAKIVAAEREHVASRCRALELFPTPCDVTLTRQGPRVLDNDNLRPALKAVRDEVASLLGLDDADPAIRWRYRQQIGEYAVIIDVTRRGEG